MDLDSNVYVNILILGLIQIPMVGLIQIPNFRFQCHKRIYFFTLEYFESINIIIQVKLLQI